MEEPQVVALNIAEAVRQGDDKKLNKWLSDFVYDECGRILTQEVSCSQKQKTEK